MIAAEGLAIGHGRAVVGRDVSLAVSPGEIVCLLGPNGCGKTTLFRTLLGLIPALAGQVTLDGRPLSALNRAAIARAMAYVPQAHVPPFPYQVEEVVLMGRTARMRPLAAPSAADRADAPACRPLGRGPGGCARLPPPRPRTGRLRTRHCRGWGSVIWAARIIHACRADSARW